MVWSVYKQLAQKGFEVRYIPDQDIPQNKMQNIKYLFFKYKIHYQTEKTPKMNYSKIY